jgi:hypothetical protein
VTVPLNINELATAAGFVATELSDDDRFGKLAALVLDAVEAMIWENDPTNTAMQGWAAFIVNHVRAMRPREDIS